MIRRLLALTTAYILVFLSISMASAGQPELVYSRSIASKETLMNQGTMACDSLGNVWIAALRTAEVNLPDLQCDEPLFKRVTLISQLNPKGEIVTSIELMAYTGNRPQNNNNSNWWGMPLLRCDKENRLWVIGGIGCEVHLMDGGREKVIDCMDKNVAVFDSRGKFLFASRIDNDEHNIPQLFADAGFDHLGRLHTLHAWSSYRYEPYNGKESKSYQSPHLVETILTGGGDLSSVNHFETGELSHLMEKSKIHFSPYGDYYISITYKTNITRNGVELVSADPSRVVSENYEQDHTAILHFTKDGDFTWNRVLFGSGDQWLDNFTSDQKHLYFTVHYSIECGINMENHIVESTPFPHWSKAILFGALKHTGEIAWTSILPTRSQLETRCRGMTADQHGKIYCSLHFCDSIRFQGKEGMLEILWQKPLDPGSCILELNDDGEFLSVRTDVIQKRGTAYSIDAQITQDRLVVLGRYFGETVGMFYSDKEKAYLDSRCVSDVYVEINGTKGKSFIERESCGGLFVYASTLVFEEKPEDDPEVFKIIEVEEKNTNDDQLSVILNVDTIPIEIDDGLEIVVDKPFANGTALENENSVTNAIAETENVFIQNATTPGLALTISPNPARFETTITADGISMYATLLIHDAKGNLISSQTNQTEGSSFTWKLDVTGWAAGNYLVTVQSANGKATKRLVRVG